MDILNVYIEGALVTDLCPGVFPRSQRTGACVLYTVLMADILQCY